MVLRKMAEMSGRIIEAQDSDVSQELESPSSAASAVSRRYVLPSGRIMPNTIFVGGIDFEMGEDEMRGFFTRYGAVKQVKIISDGGGVSRGYGFVSFHNDVDIQKIISESQINFKGKKLKIGPAIRKQQDSYPIHLVQARPAPLITSPTPCVCQNADTYFQSPGFPGSALQYVQTYSYPSPPAVALPQVQMGYPHPAYNYQAATQWPPGGQWRWMMPQVMPTTGTYVNSPYPEMINPGTVFVQRECDAQQPPSSPLDSVEKNYVDRGVQTQSWTYLPMNRRRTDRRASNGYVKEKRVHRFTV
ncbi:deleted in azoospermia-like isoform X4 [Scyliorhinus canicula]|uniref:deleted in azoospermia-like isoform X4 n=1 Tax=Scyliorhinus canicula TaxID=7830 RepID=UPI0018F6DC41|nr:deleted in azoospermia-like isoform X4 [Scyliorhinus canicula]